MDSLARRGRVVANSNRKVGAHYPARGIASVYRGAKSMVVSTCGFDSSNVAHGVVGALLSTSVWQENFSGGGHAY